MDICGCSFLLFCFIFLFLFPHETGGVCKCASAIWTLSCVGFFLRKSGRYHKNMDTILRLDLCVWSWRIDDPPRRKGREIKDGLCLWSAGLQNPGGKRRWYVYTWLVRLSPPQPSEALTNSPMHFCSFKLWGTILGMRAQLQQEDCYDFDKVTEKNIFPNWNKRLEKNVFSHLLYITIFLYYLSEKKETLQMDEGKIHAMLTIWSECSSRKPIFLSIVWDGLAVSFP